MHLCKRCLAQIASCYKTQSANGIAHLPRFNKVKKLALCHYRLIRQSGKNFVFVQLCGKVEKCMCFPCLSHAPTKARKTDTLFCIRQKTLCGIRIAIAFEKEQKVILLCQGAKLAHELRD